MCVFDHEGSHSGAFAVFECLNDPMMLSVRVKQLIVHARQINLIERYGMRGRERDPIVAANRLGDHLTACPLNNEGMKLLVHVAVPGFIGKHQMAFGENLVAFPQTLMQRVDESAGRSLFGEHARRQALKRTTNINRVHDFLGGERPHNETTSVQLSEHALLRKHRQGFANRSSRDSQPRRQFDLPDSLARRQLAVQNHFANSYDDS